MQQVRAAGAQCKDLQQAVALLAQGQVLSSLAHSHRALELGGQACGAVTMTILLIHHDCVLAPGRSVSRNLWHSPHVVQRADVIDPKHVGPTLLVDEAIPPCSLAIVLLSTPGRWLVEHALPVCRTSRHMSDAAATKCYVQAHCSGCCVHLCSMAGGGQVPASDSGFGVRPFHSNDCLMLVDLSD